MTHMTHGPIRAVPRRLRLPKVRQLTIHPRGGARPGAGRRPKGPRSLVTHLPRPALAPRFPVHVTMRLRAGLPSLREMGAFRVLRERFRVGGDRFGLRLVHYSVQTNHLHLLIEARDAASLTRGMQGLAVRIARGLNRWWQRRGTVFADRFHAHILRGPREVRHALAYVLNNARKHGVRVAGIDAFSSGAAFDGWRSERVEPRVGLERMLGAAVCAARSWLLARGWRRHGRIDSAEIPGPRRTSRIRVAPG